MIEDIKRSTREKINTHVLTALNDDVIASEKTLGKEKYFECIDDII